MSEEPTLGPPPNDGHGFRATVGLLSVVGALAGFAMLFFVEVPEGNREPMLLALGIVFGWGSAVVQSEYGASSTGRKAADAPVKQIENGSRRRSQLGIADTEFSDQT